MVPTVEDIKAIHDEDLERTGHAAGILFFGSLKAAVDRAKDGPFEGPGSIVERAAFLLRGLCQDHPFVDANKRTAFAATETLLERAGFHVDADPEAVVRFVVNVARGEADIEGILAWLARHVDTLKGTVQQ